MPSRRLLATVAASAAVLAACVPPAFAKQVRPVRLRVGEAFVVSGQTGSGPGQIARAVGLVVVRGRWDHAAWRVVTTTRTDRKGRYRFTIRPRRRGLLTLRVVTPDRLSRRFVLSIG